MNRFLRAVLVSPPCFPDVDFDALTGNPVDHETVLLSRKRLAIICNRTR